MVINMNGILLRIMNNKDSFSSKELIVADAIISNPGKLLTSTITEYADFINTSPATVTRFCKRLNVSGFQELKLLIAKATNYDDLNIGSIERMAEESTMETSEGIINSVMVNAISSIDRLRGLLDITTLEKVTSRIVDSRHILICGVGASGVVAKDFHQKLVRIGILSHCDDDFDLAKVQVTSFDNRDLVIAFSYSGMKSEIKSIVSIAKNKGASIVAITRAGNNPISNMADYHIPVVPSEAIVRDGATVSRLQMLIVVDILYQMLINTNTGSALETLKETWMNVASEGKDE
ncbi:MAG: MurR/RpiR family transcriptional regulator [Spirochaetales bacterium]|nr:MurR/RpiR family transcriptional regulator [Spirochaetales bacterium]